MLPRDVFQKIRRIEITTNRLVTDVFAGQYHSVFRGLGMEFDEVREYQIGDEIRTIDWNVTARSGKVHVKKYVEERELTVMILVDGSLSCRFSSQQELKSRLAAQIAAVLAFAAIRNNDKVGLIFFTDGIEKFIPPRKGRMNVLRLIREILYFEPKGRGTDIRAVLDFLNKVMTRQTVSFLISDFFDPRLPVSDPAFKRALAIANRRHDLIAVTLNDPRESVLPDCGLLDLEDAENGTTATIDCADPQVRREYEEKARGRQAARSRLFDRVGMDHIDISTDRPYAQDLVKFFLQRRKRR